MRNLVPYIVAVLAGLVGAGLVAVVALLVMH